jgi:APA family basic amino acid/polyamine antiporter
LGFLLSGLQRALNRGDLTSLVINATIGAGILGLPGRLYALVGIWCVPLCLVGGALMGLVAACFAMAGSRFTRSGGAYLFVHEAFGPAWGLAMGLLGVFSRLATFATIANLVILYGSGVFPALAGGAARAAAISVLTLLLAVVVYRGVALSARAHDVFATCKLGLLLGFCALAAPTLWRPQSWANGVAFTPLPPPSHWAPALLLLLFGMMGLEAVSVGNGEMRHPARDIPAALAAGMATVVAVYAGVLLCSAALVPDLAHASRPLFEGANIVSGPAGGAVVVAGGIVSMAGVLFVIMFSVPRELYAMALNRQIPAGFARLHARFATPGLAIGVFAGLAWATALGGTFLGALAAATLSRLAMYAATAAALLALQRRGTCETAAPLILPGARGIAAAVIILCAGVMVTIACRSL